MKLAVCGVKNQTRHIMTTSSTFPDHLLSPLLTDCVYSFLPSVRIRPEVQPSMSLLAPGTRCSSCTLVDFLPLLCPSCDLPFCPNHIYIHQPCSSLGSTSSHGVAVGKLDRGKKTCEKEGCERETIESVAGVSGRDEEGIIAREVRCEGCGGAFCTSYVTLQLRTTFNRPQTG